MIDIATAGELLDFGARMGAGPRADEQLEGAVAIHNILTKHRVAYLADEVGMGKTYIALGALALFRHFQPRFRVLVIAPRENIQRKWMKELGNFSAFNVRFSDLRNRTIDGQPGRPLVACNRLTDLVHETAVDPHRDFFARLSSFSLGLTDGEDRAAWRRLRDEVLKSIPWLNRDLLSTRLSKDAFKDNIARAICCALPPFDLVIVDEGHNLKHGFTPSAAARNRVLALAMGHSRDPVRQREYRDYGPRAKRVLFLSATPLEESYRHIWNQLDVFGHAEPFDALRDGDVDEEARKDVARRFLIRRVTSMRIAGEERTKNQYRREWRRGGVALHDEPVTITDPKHRLVVALVQKKVAELLGSERFNMSFQVGMLASFESFLETARLKDTEEATPGNFDDPDQTTDMEEREGIDVRDLNRLSKGYRARFDQELPHPKMDALLGTLQSAWQHGRKSLVFVRRVASVGELKRKLDRSYDDWLIGVLRDRLPEQVRETFDRHVDRYAEARRTSEAARVMRASKAQTGEDQETEAALADRGGTDTFFAWFFRGEGPRGVVSGANVQRRFIQKGTSYATFFEDNFIAELLAVEPGGVTEALAAHLSCSVEEVRARLQAEAVRYLSKAKRPPRGDRVEAYQAAALVLLKTGSDDIATQARLIWHERFESSLKKEAAAATPVLSDELEVSTFFTELRKPEWADLRAALWPAPSQGDPRVAFREAQLRARLLATAARLGHALIDLYVVTIKRLGSLELRTLDRDSGDDASTTPQAISEYLEELERQRRSPLAERYWGAFDELSALSNNFHLLLDVNASEARETPLVETARLFGVQLGQQQPTAGMSGQVNRTVVQQFRMPGYPFVLITTDLLQEGEDLHTFCSNVFHYGVTWTPSAMEQRIGRIDRVRSLSDRRLNGAIEEPAGDDLLQVFYPFLADTVEVLQVNRVLERMNTFLRLMHEGLGEAAGHSKSVDVGRELTRDIRSIEAIRCRLTTAFPIQEWARGGKSRRLAAGPQLAEDALARFARLREDLPDRVTVEWEPSTGDGRLLGTALLPDNRIQPFTLLLRSDGSRLVVRCVSPVGRVNAGKQVDEVWEAGCNLQGHIGLLLTEDATQYDLTVEDDVGLAAAPTDAARVALLLKRVVTSADILEQHHFEEVDHPMNAFEIALRKEGRHGG